MTKTQEPNALVRAAIDYWEGLKNLAGCPREIWIAYLIKILEGLCYFSSVLVLMIFLTQDMGLSDEVAGTIFGIFSASMSFFMLFVGFIADSIGIKRALLVGLVVALVGRIAITFTTHPWVVYPGLFVLSVGFAYMIPLIAAAVKLFSTKKAQKYAYSWYYVVMNIGAFLAGISLDWLRTTFTSVLHFEVVGIELAVRPTQIIFLVAVVSTLISLVLVFFLVRSRIPPEELGEEATAPGDAQGAATEGSPQESAARAPQGESTFPASVEKEEELDPAEGAAAAADTKTPVVEAAKPRKSVWQIMKEVGTDRLFWIFILFMFLLVLVKMIFQYNHSLYPLYMERIGLKEWTGKLYSINPIIIIFLVPVMTALTGKMKAYHVITLGCFISASSVLLLGLGEQIYLIVLFQVVLSIGEALWSPRLYDYTANVAPPGKEASYMALSKVPMFFAKVGAGPASGFLLATLCAPTGPRNTELMWIIVGLSTLVSPLTLLIGKRWLDVESRRSTSSSPERA